MAKRKPISIAKLKAKVQDSFNRYIRERDRNPDGTWTCISCGKTSEFIHAGHYFPVKGFGHMRFDEDNVHSQCAGCNTYKGGNIQMYRRNLIKKIGLERLEDLEDRAINGLETSNEFKRETLMELLEKYKGC